MSKEMESLRRERLEQEKMIDNLQKDNDASSRQVFEMQQAMHAVSADNERLRQEMREPQEVIKNLQEAMHSTSAENSSLHIHEKELEVRLEERTQQHIKLENENVRLRGELSDIMSSLVLTYSVARSDSDGSLSPAWEVVSADQASPQLASSPTRSHKGKKKIRRSLKSRRKLNSEQLSIPETAGEY